MSSEKTDKLPAVILSDVLLILCSIRNISGFKRGEATTDGGDWFVFDIGAEKLPNKTNKTNETNQTQALRL